MKNAETSINEVQLIRRLEDQNGVINSVACYGNQLIASGSGLVGQHLFEILFDNQLWTFVTIIHCHAIFVKGKCSIDPSVAIMII